LALGGCITERSQTHEAEMMIGSSRRSEASLGSGSLELATVTHADQRRLRPTTMQRSTELGFAERLQSPM